MKRISFLMITLIMTIGMVMAQAPQRGSRKQIDPKERAEKMTERMVKEYGLNDSQKAKLLELNIAQAENMNDRPAQRPDRKNRDGKKSKSDVKKENTDTEKKEMNKEEREKRFAEMKKAREAYEASLKDILTADQYKKYQSDQVEREKKMSENRKARRNN